MNKKLTLYIDEYLIEFAHSYSKRTKQSISHLVEQYLERIQKKNTMHEVSPETMRLYGILKHEDIPDKKQMRKVFHEKDSDRSQYNS